RRADLAGHASSVASKPQRQAFKSALVCTILPPDGLSGQFDTREALQKCSETGLSFQACKCCADANVRAAAEDRLGVRLPGDVEIVGILEANRVPVYRANQTNGHRAGGNSEPTALEVLDRHPKDEVDAGL